MLMNSSPGYAGRCSRVIGLGSTLFVLSVAPVIAQQTRAEEQAKKQAEKATRLRPFVSTAGERAIEAIGNMFTPPVGLYPFVGGVMPGGGIAAGPGLRLPYGDTGVFNAHAAWSIRNYKAVNAGLALPAFADRRVRIGVNAGWLDAPRVAFYGLGTASRKGDLARFLYRPTTAGLTGSVSLTRWLALGGGADYLDIRTDRGHGPTSIEQVFTPTDAPGLGLDPTYIVGRAFAEIDWRQSPGYTTSGGFYRVDWANYAQRNDGAFSFRRLDAEVDQFIPLLRANWVIALRALVSTTDVDGGRQVPYFLMPSLGGGSELRAFPNFRFRDRNRLLLTAEYRWTPSRFLDMALFYEAGKVTARTSELDLEGLRRSYGVGARVHGPIATPVRLELARGTEGIRLIIAFSPSF